MDHLLAWKQSTRRKPLTLNGARQVGKTWLLKRFGEDHFDQLLYFNCEGNDILKAVFEVDFSIERIIRSLLGLSGATTIDPERTFISHVAHHDRPVATASPATSRSSHNGSPVPLSAAPAQLPCPRRPRSPRRLHPNSTKARRSGPSGRQTLRLAPALRPRELAPYSAVASRPTGAATGLGAGCSARLKKNRR